MGGLNCWLCFVQAATRGCLSKCAAQQPSKDEPCPTLLYYTCIPPHFYFSRLCVLWCIVFVPCMPKIPFLACLWALPLSLCPRSVPGQCQRIRQKKRLRRSWTSFYRAPKYRRSRGTRKIFFLHRTEMSCDNIWRFTAHFLAFPERSAKRFRLLYCRRVLRSVLVFFFNRRFLLSVLGFCRVLFCVALFSSCCGERGISGGTCWYCFLSHLEQSVTTPHSRGNLFAMQFPRPNDLQFRRFAVLSKHQGAVVGGNVEVGYAFDSATFPRYVAFLQALSVLVSSSPHASHGARRWIVFEDAHGDVEELSGALFIVFNVSMCAM